MPTKERDITRDSEADSRARIADLTRRLADLKARLRILQIEKALFDLASAKAEGATQWN